MCRITRRPLKSVPLDAAFMFDNSTTIFEHRGNGWYQTYGQTETGGPWVADGETIVTVVSWFAKEILTCVRN